MTAEQRLMAELITGEEYLKARPARPDGRTWQPCRACGGDTLTPPVCVGCSSAAGVGMLRHPL